MLLTTSSMTDLIQLNLASLEEPDHSPLCITFLARLNFVNLKNEDGSNIKISDLYYFFPSYRLLFLFPAVKWGLNGSHILILKVVPNSTCLLCVDLKLVWDCVFWKYVFRGSYSLSNYHTRKTFVTIKGFAIAILSSSIEKRSAPNKCFL